MSEPRIAFCITCKGRAQHVKETLPKNLIDNHDYPNAVFVLLNYFSDDDLMDYVSNHHARDIQSGRLVVYSMRGTPTQFRMAHAKNVSHRLGILEGADILCNLDADNFTGPGFAWFIALEYRTPGIFMAIGRIVPGVTPRGVSGRIVVHKDQFINAGGYDERFDTWAPDDKDFNHRLRRMGYEWRQIPPMFLNCVRHNDKMRFKDYKHVASTAHSHHEMVVQEADTTVANYGKLGCATVARNWDCWEYKVPPSFRKLKSLVPIPTRIFGIGMHKTGTTSLHHALEILGYQSSHWNSAHWAKSIWNEMHEFGRSRTVEQTYAVCDFPITALFKQLDKAYRGSKFILTIRDEREWLESVRKHWSREHNQFRDAWDQDPFTHKIHRAIYGRKNFDAEIFLERYRRHNAEVLEYFKDRPNDLLVMTIDSGWSQLCQFLSVDRPSVTYPRANVAKLYAPMSEETILQRDQFLKEFEKIMARIPDA